MAASTDCAPFLNFGPKFFLTVFDLSRLAENLFVNVRHFLETRMSLVVGVEEMLDLTHLELAYAWEISLRKDLPIVAEANGIRPVLYSGN